MSFSFISNSEDFEGIEEQKQTDSNIILDENLNAPCKQYPDLEEKALHVMLEEDVPDKVYYPGLQENINYIWLFIKESFNVPDTSPAPVINFGTDFNTNKALDLIAVHYYNTNCIQIYPKKVFPGYSNGYPDLVRMGFYIIGHEMLHYAFQEKGILPYTFQKKGNFVSSDHHCLFILPLFSNGQSPLGMLSKFLIFNGISSKDIMRYGWKIEIRNGPCQGRDEASLRQLRQIALSKILQIDYFKDITD